MTTTRTPLQSSAAPRAQGDAWLGETLGRLLGHVRTLLPVDGAVFLMVAGEPHGLLVTRIAGLLLSAIAVQLIANAVSEFIKAG